MIIIVVILIVIIMIIIVTIMIIIIIVMIMIIILIIIVIVIIIVVIIIVIITIIIVVIIIVIVIIMIIKLHSHLDSLSLRFKTWNPSPGPCWPGPPGARWLPSTRSLTAVGVGLAEVWRGGGLNGQLGRGNLPPHGVSSAQPVLSVGAHLEATRST